MPDYARSKMYMRVAIGFAALNLLMLIAALFLVGEVTSLRESSIQADAKQRQSILNQRAACERANGSREAVRFLLRQQKQIADVVSGEATSAELRGYFRAIRSEYDPYLKKAGVQERNCVADYPLP